VGAGPLASIFLSALEGERRDPFAALADLEERLRAALTAAREAWPEVALADEEFVRHFGQTCREGGPLEVFDHLRPADLFLAAACARGAPGALEGFERGFGADVAAAVRRFASPSLAADDLRQALHEKLFVGREDRPPKIAEYSGQGFLQNWIRITAVRTFTDLARAAQRRREDPDDELVVAASEDLELAFLKQRYRGVFKEAFEQAISALDSRDRNMLRHSVVRGLGIDQIAAIYHIHRATAARRLGKARDALLEATRRGLMDRLRIDRQELDSVMDLIRSRLDVSIHRVLGSHTEAG
jgi:RNA polymerase sigma-70 factor, ECF subfamily